MAVCKTCDGKRIVFGFGGMKKECPDCSKAKIIEKPKRGRPAMDKKEV